MHKVVFFENLYHIHRPLVAWHLWRGHTVLVFDFGQWLKRVHWTRRLLHQGRIKRIFVHPGASADGMAMEAAERFYARTLKHPLVQAVGRMAGAQEVAPLFKYALVQSISRYLYVRLYLEKFVQEQDAHTQVVLIPEYYTLWNKALAEWCRGRLKPLPEIRFPRWSTLWTRPLCAFWEQVRHLPRYLACGIFLLASSLARAWVGGKRQTRHSLKDRPKVLYFITSKAQTKFTDYRKFHFLIDQRILTKDNTQFFVDRTADGPWVDSARRLGYQIFRSAELFSLAGCMKGFPSAFSLGAAWQIFLTALRAWDGLDWMHPVASQGLWIWLRESEFFEQFSSVQFVYADQYGLVPRWRNVLIRRIGSASWNYAHSNAGLFLYREGGAFAGGTDFGGRHLYWSHENADHFVSPSQGLIEYHQRHPQQVRHYHNVGNLWSEQILAAAKQVDRRLLRQSWFGPLANSRKIIAWFDTSFAEFPNAISSYAEAIQWYKDILKMVEGQEDLLMVIKPSKKEAYFIDEGPHQQWAQPQLGRQLIDVWDLAKRHPRIRFLPHTQEPTEIVVGSDLTVTYCFSAVSAEALGARKRAIWYEPGERWRDTPWGKEPLLVAHGYPQLEALVRKLLFEMSDTAYELFLDETVRGLIEERLDGKGLSRFRALLVGEAVAELKITPVLQTAGAQRVGSR